MLDFDAVGAVIRLGVGLVILMFVLFRVRGAFTDSFRQRMTALDQKMYILLVSGAVRHGKAFDRIAGLIGVMIRHAERLSLSRVVFMISMGALENVGTEESLDSLLDRSDPQTKRELSNVRVAFAYEVLRGMTFGSIVAWPLLLIVRPLARLIGLGKKLHAWLTKPAQPTMMRIERAAAWVITEEALATSVA